VTTALSVILILSALLPGCSLLEDTTTTTAPHTLPTVTKAGPGGTREVGFLAVLHLPGRDPSGSLYRCVVEVVPHTTGSVAVGVIEGEVFGTGAMWRAACWAAPIAAASILNLDLADFRFTYQVEGSTDGPSAGALLTCATLAALLGDELLPEATMTGTINPDWTIGPVGGIAYKLEGAADAGKTTVLIPYGQRMEYNSLAGRWIDLVEWGHKLGVEVYEVGSIFEAYRLLTGRNLPEAAVSTASSTHLDLQAAAAVKQQTAEWIAYCQEQLDEYAALAGTEGAAPDQSYELARIADAERALNDTGDFLRQGLIGPAYFSSVNAARNALLAVNYAAVDRRIMNDGEEAALIVLRELSTTPRTDTMMEQLLQVTPTTVGEALSVMEAWGYWAVASGFALDADAALDNAAQSPGDYDLVEAIYQAVFGYTLSGVMIDAALDAFALGQEIPTSPIRSADAVSELAEAYRRAASANWENISALVLPGLAAELGVSVNEAAYLLEQQDIDYAETAAVMGNLMYLINYIPEGPDRDYATLGVAITAFADSASVLAKYESYGAEFDDSGVISGFREAKALSAALDFAQERAQKMIALASAEGASSVALPIMYLETAAVEREGTGGQKLNALYDYWMATLYARVMALLEGELTALVP
jgi:hypothetical protein